MVSLGGNDFLLDDMIELALCAARDDRDDLASKVIRGLIDGAMPNPQQGGIVDEKALSLFSSDELVAELERRGDTAKAVSGPMMTATELETAAAADAKPAKPKGKGKATAEAAPAAMPEPAAADPAEEGIPDFMKRTEAPATTAEKPVAADIFGDEPVKAEAPPTLEEVIAVGRVLREKDEKLFMEICATEGVVKLKEHPKSEYARIKAAFEAALEKMEA